MPEIRPQEIASFWKFPIRDIPIDKLSIQISHNVSAEGEKREWQPIDDENTLEMFKFPISEEDLLNFIGPGEYSIALKYQKDDSGKLFCYGRPVYIKVANEVVVASEVVATTTTPEVVPTAHSPETELLRASLAEQRETLAGQKATIDMMLQTMGKLVDAQKTSDNQFKDQLLMKVIDKMGSNQVDVGGIYAKALDTSALLESKRFDVMAENKKEETELKRQESKQKHEINLITLQQRIEAGAAGLGELKNDGSPEDEIKKTNVVQDIVDAITKIGPVIDNFGEFVAKVKPTLISIKDIINIAQGTPLAVGDTETEDENGEEPADDVGTPAEEPGSVQEPELPDDESPATAGTGGDPNDPRKQ